MTLRYGHLAPEHLRTAVARLDAALPAPTEIPAQGPAQEPSSDPLVYRKSLMRL